MKIWQKYILSKLVKTFVFLLFSFFLLYFFVDLSVHGVRFFSKSTLVDVIIYYFYTFSTLYDLFIALAFLLASIKVLFDLSLHRELVALQVAGLSKRKILAPFFIFALTLSVTSYINNEYFSPKAQNNTISFKVTHKDKNLKKEKKQVHSKTLKDETEIVYQSFDSKSGELFDVYLIISPDEIWHMKSLNLHTSLGKYANHLVRKEGFFINEKNYPEKTFPNLHLDKKTILKKQIAIENRAISLLVKESLIHSTEHPRILSHLYYKIFTPLLSFFTLFAIGPICLKFSRDRPLFVIGAISIFSFIAIKVILDGMLILGENKVFSPNIAILLPIFLLFSLSITPFFKMK